MNGFYSLCVAFSIGYLVLVVVAASQLSKLFQASGGSRRCFQFSYQQKIHGIILLISLARIPFFLLAIKSWNISGNIISYHKMWFYSLDEISTVLYLCLCSTLASFWAELYYISTGSLKSFTNFVKPMVMAINFVSILGIPFCTYAVSQDTDAEGSFVFIEYTVLVVSMFSVAALVFGYFSYLAVIQLRSVPIEPNSRISSLFSLRMLGIICLFGLLSRAFIFLMLYETTISTSSFEFQLFIGIYYCVLEMFPIISVLVYYRVSEIDYREDDDIIFDSVLKDDMNDEVNERAHLLMAKQHYQHPYDPLHGRDSVSNLSKYVDNPTKAAPVSIVDAVIASLSTGPNSTSTIMSTKATVSGQGNI